MTRYDYVGPDGAVRYRVHRGPGKQFWQSTLNDRGRWVNVGPSDDLKVPYRLSEVIAAVEAGNPILIPEGEKDADNLIALGLAATCNVGGAGKWLPSYGTWFKGAEVYVLADNDAPGIAHAGHVADCLLDAAAEVRQVMLPGLPPKGDVSDWLAMGGDRKALARLCAKAPLHRRGDLLRPNEVETGGPLPEAGAAVAEGASAAPSDAVTADPPRIQSRVTRLADISPRGVEWLVPGWIPRGKLTVLEGRPGLGKSTLLIDLVARVTNGQSWPGFPDLPPRRALYLSAEDDAADTVRPRLDAAGGDPTMVGMLIGGLRMDERAGTVPFDVDLAHPDGLAVLEDAVRRDEVALVVVDVFVAFLGGAVDSYRDQDIRSVMRPLSEVAQRTGAAIVLVRHLRKSTGGGAIAAGGGSIGIAGAARSVILVDLDPDDPERRVVASVKMNVAPAPVSLGFRMVSSGSVARVEWLGACTHTAESLTAARDTGESGGPRNEAADLLRSWLSSGPMERQAVMAAARKAGISPATMDRAAGDLRIRKNQVGFGSAKRSEWSLPDAIPLNDPQSNQLSRHEGVEGIEGIEGIGRSEPQILEVEI